MHLLPDTDVSFRNCDLQSLAVRALLAESVLLHRPFHRLIVLPGLEQQIFPLRILIKDLSE